MSFPSPSVILTLKLFNRYGWHSGSPVILVAHRLQPGGGAEGDRQMSHRVLLVGVGAVPVLGPCRDAGHVPRRRIDRAFAALLHPALTFEEVDPLPPGVRMPVRAPAAPKRHPTNVHRPALA